TLFSAYQANSFNVSNTILSLSSDVIPSHSVSPTTATSHSSLLSFIKEPVTAKNCLSLKNQIDHISSLLTDDDKQQFLVESKDFLAEINIAIQQLLNQTQSPGTNFTKVETSGYGLRCGYYAIASCVLEGLSNEKKHHVLSQLGIQPQDADMLNQRTLGDILYRFVQQNKEHIVDQKINALIAKLQQERVLEQQRAALGVGYNPDNPLQQYSDEDIVNLRAILRQDIVGHNNISADKLKFIGEFLGLQVITHDHDQSLDPNRDDFIYIQNKHGYHYEALIPNR
ncbi:hypothetical protein DID75_05885, partial [Candidatus Marinamargulisbacteria bacterium SCGC AG-410-N11]